MVFEILGLKMGNGFWSEIGYGFKGTMYKKPIYHLGPLKKRERKLPNYPLIS